MKREQTLQCGDHIHRLKANEVSQKYVLPLCFFNQLFCNDGRPFVAASHAVCEQVAFYYRKNETFEAVFPDARHCDGKSYTTGEILVCDSCAKVITPRDLVLSAEA